MHKSETTFRVKISLGWCNSKKTNILNTKVNFLNKNYCFNFLCNSIKRL